MDDFLAKWKRIFTDADLKDNYSSYVNRWNEKINAFLNFSTDSATAGSASDSQLLGDVPFGVKDNIAVKGLGLTCGSKILKETISPYHSTAVQKLLSAGARVVGKTNLDEFGMGSSNENSFYGPVSNPWKQDYVPGGSSGGSAAAVAAGLVPFALGSDTGGSVRQPASFCGVYGLKPTYGTVSRYGLVAYASSLEVIGVLGLDPRLIETVYLTIAGEDPADHSSVPYPTLKNGPDKKEIQTIGVLSRDSLDLIPDAAAGYEKCLTALSEQGYIIKEIEIPALDYTVYAYYTIAAAEASANLARYNGIRYGYRTPSDDTYEKMVVSSRTEGFGDEVKLRILLGTFVLRSGFQDQYYIRAQKIRTAILNGFNKAFNEVDGIVMPVFPTNAFPQGDSVMTPLQQKLADNYTASANLAGIPALAFPVSVENGLPVGMQMLAPAFEEERLFRFAEKWDGVNPPETCPGYLAPGEWR